MDGLVRLAGAVKIGLKVDECTNANTDDPPQSELCIDRSLWCDAMRSVKQPRKL